MSCERPSLFTNRTLCPAEIVTDDGFTAPFAMVMVAPMVPTDPVDETTGPDGTVGLLPPPPQALMATSAINAPILVPLLTYPFFTASPNG